ncbi:MAG: hypothetical protein K2Q32_09130 [Alphaproteobacteria bacterium]|nr:hypothetical protein [Alphaproteobacteria bacterium]
MVQHILKNRRLLRETFKLVGEAHKNEYRSRINSDGKRRSYDHHPMEVALLFAEMEVFSRRAKHRKLTSEQVAKKIIEIAERNAHMNKRQLKSRLLAVSRYMNNKQMTIIVGLLCHDAMEADDKKATSQKEKNQAREKRISEIKALRPGAEKIALRLTNSKRYKNKQQKRAHQVQLARNRQYARLKMYDIIANMADQMLIPDEVRSLRKKLTLLKHMNKFMRVAYKDKNIPFCFYRASERIYENAKALQQMTLAA